MPDTPPTDTPARPADGQPGYWAWFVLLFGGWMWGATFSLAKIATEAGAHPAGITHWQAVIGAALLIVFLAARRRGIPIDRAHLIFYVVCGFLGTVIPSILFFYAAPVLPAGVLSIAIATVPLATFLIALVIRIERFVVLRFTGVLLGIAAIVMLIAPETSLPDPGAAPWVLAAIAASLCYAAENIFIAVRLPRGTGAGSALAGMLCVASAVLTPLVLATGTFTPLGADLDGATLSIVAMSAINVLSYGLFVYLVSLAGPVFASQMAYVVTVSGIAWGMLIFGERHSMWIWAAVAVLFAGLALVQPRRSGRRAALT